MASLFKCLLSAAAIFYFSPAHADVEVSTKPTQNMSCSGGVCTPTAKKAVLSADDLEEMLASGNTTIRSTAQNPDIRLDASLSWSGVSRLTLDSYHSIVFDRPLVIAGSGALTITTNEGKTDGDYAFSGNGHVEFHVLPSSLIINGVDYILLKNTKQIVKFFKRHGGYVALAGSYDAAKDGIYAHALIPELNGAFEGLGNTISNLSIVSSDPEVGFIGDTYAYSSTIRDLGLPSANVRGTASHQMVGALVGRDETDADPISVSNCFATGQVSGGENSYVGGLVGILDGFVLIQKSYASATVTAGVGSSVGGLIGYNYDGYVWQTYATGEVTGGDNATVGGLAGLNASPDWDRGIFDSYATGNSSGGASASVGGLVGVQFMVVPDERAHAHIGTSYSTGVVSGGVNSLVGGLVGDDTLPAGYIVNGYWDLDTSGIGNLAQGAGNIPNDSGITGLSDTQLKSGLPAGFNPSVWKQSVKLNGGYPYQIDNAPAK